MNADGGAPGMSDFLSYEFTVLAFTVHACGSRAVERNNGPRNNGKLKTQKGAR
jgi:hypothetical protein